VKGSKLRRAALNLADREDSMKTALFRITMTGMLALALMAATARSQEQPLLVNIPFAFAAGRMALPAGEYRVQKVAYDCSALLIQRTDHAAATVVTSFAAQANAKQAQSTLVIAMATATSLPRSG